MAWKRSCQCLLLQCCSAALGALTVSATAASRVMMTLDEPPVSFRLRFLRRRRRRRRRRWCWFPSFQSSAVGLPSSAFRLLNYIFVLISSLALPSERIFVRRRLDDERWGGTSVHPSHFRSVALWWLCDSNVMKEETNAVLRRRRRRRKTI